jgi:amidase
MSRSLPGNNVIMAQWVGQTASDIAAAVRSGEVTARDIVAQHLDRIARLNPELGAFVRVRSGEAIAEAEKVDAQADRAQLPLAGVPVAIKDNIPVAGEPMRFGSAAAADEPQREDHPLVARLRAAGAVVVGLTNLPELAIYPMTDSTFGVARNPWNRRRTPGGSSGGSAAAVASAMVPVAHGNDGLGSIRIPAAACGLVGFKPGTGVVPSQIGADSWRDLSENGPLATTVADARLVLEVMADMTFGQEQPSGLRIAASVKATGPGIMVHPGYVAAAHQCGALLATLGHTVVDEDPPYPLWFAPATIARWFASPIADAEPYLIGRGLEPRTRRHLATGQVMMRVRPPNDTDRDRLRAVMDPFFNRYDVLVMPILGTPCPAAKRWGERSWLLSALTAIRFAPMTGVWNVAGYPAMAVPFGPAVTGLPGSVQLVAAPGGESVLLALAEQLEQASGWPRHAPAYKP